MGLHQGQLANFTSRLETPASLTFPSSSSVLKEIPLFLKFTCIEYSMQALARSGTGWRAGAIGNIKAQISVPVPSKLVSQTAMRYKQEENEFFKTVEQEVVERGIEFATGSGLDRILKGLAGRSPVFRGIGRFLSGKMAQAIRSYGQMIETDFTETILQSGSKRSFIINLYLPCLNEEDSKNAAEIARAFEALALPTLANIGVSIPLIGQVGALIHFHPPMWFFGIGKLGDPLNDIDWTSQPQASVLTNVAVTRTPIDATAFTALDLGMKPLAYSITLNFQEIETAFRKVNSGAQTGFEIQSRSAAAYSSSLLNIGRIIGNVQGNKPQQGGPGRPPPEGGNPQATDPTGGGPPF